MACPVIVRRHDGFRSYLVLDENNPRELLFHYGFTEAFSTRPWLGDLDPVDAREQWAEMLGEDLENYAIIDENNWEYCQDRHNWDSCTWAVGLSRKG